MLTMYTKEPDVLMEINEGVMELKLNRPKRLNAFSVKMVELLKKYITKANKMKDIKLIKISGNGRAFCAGGDVKNMGSRDAMGTYDHIGKTNELILTMNNSRLPIISVVHGYAAGVGFNLALASDIILAEEDTKFILSFSKVGLVPDGGGSYLLPRVIGPQRAKELLFNATPITAKEAHQLNLINHVYSKSEFVEKTNKFIEGLKKGPIETFGFIKEIINRSMNSTLEETLEFERSIQSIVATSDNHKEGISAFIEKRNPLF